MAEIGVVASIVQIADTGIRLTLALHEFGSNVVGAREQTEEIADGVSIYCMTLKELAARIKEDEPILSTRGVRLARELQEKSEKTFEKIAALLPTRNKPDKMTAVQRVKWNFKKKKVEWLLAQLNGLKLSLLVLIQILYAGRIIKVARDDGDTSEETKEHIGVQKAHFGILVVQRCRQQSRLPDMAEDAEKEEKVAIEASPSEPPEGFAPVDSNALALVKYEDNPFNEVDAAIQDSREPSSNALVLHQPDLWFESLVDQLTIALRPAVEESTSRRESSHNAHSAEYPRQGEAAIRLAVVQTHGEDAKESWRGEGDCKSGRKYRSMRGYHRASVESEPDKSATTDESSSDHDVPDHLPSNLQRRHTTTDLAEKPNRDLPLIERPKNLSVQGLRYTPTNLTGQSLRTKRKHGIKWRRGKGPVGESAMTGPVIWREFQDEKLVDFRVSNVSWNITKADFRGRDKWTEIPKSGQITEAGLDHWKYPYYEYERFSHMEYDTDIHGNRTGPGKPVYVSVYHVEVPLLFEEMVKLAKGVRSAKYSTPLPPLPRSECDLDDDLDYPDAPAGRAAFGAQRLLNKGSRWLNTVNFVATALADPKDPSQHFDKIIRAVRSAGKDIPLLEQDEDVLRQSRRIEDLGDVPRSPRGLRRRQTIQE